MKRPSFQFYPGDWTSDLKLRRCSPAARGVWLDVICAFHDSDDGYGLLRWPLKDISNTIGADMKLLRELAEKGVLRGSDKAITEPLVYTPRSGRKEGASVALIGTQAGPLWYSKRMVVDEHIRTIRGESSRFGADDGGAPKQPPKASPKPPFGDGTSSPSSSSPSGISEAEASGAKPPADKAKAELWKAAVSLLSAQGMPEPQARALFGKLAKDYPDGDIVLHAVQAAISEQPADARAYLKATCQRLAGERKRDGGLDWTASAK